MKMLFLNMPNSLLLVLVICSHYFQMISKFCNPMGDCLFLLRVYSVTRVCVEGEESGFCY